MPFSFQPNLAVYGNLANIRKGGDTEAPPPLPAYKVEKPPARSVIELLTWLAITYFNITCFIWKRRNRGSTRLMWTWCGHRTLNVWMQRNQFVLTITRFILATVKQGFIQTSEPSSSVSFNYYFSVYFVCFIYRIINRMQFLLFNSLLRISC